MQNNLNGDVFEIFLDHISSRLSLKLTHHAGNKNLILTCRGISVPPVPIKDVNAEWLIEKIVSALFLTTLKRKNGGTGGIRTLDTGISPYDDLANRCLQPLGHRSNQAHELTELRGQIN